MGPRSCERGNIGKLTRFINSNMASMGPRTRDCLSKRDLEEFIKLAEGHRAKRILNRFFPSAKLSCKTVSAFFT